ncbi:MAG: 3-dehydroquinate synthase [Erysipelotrichaceae bacterium]|nr:3-dehydroquinate synthase [Erysipelotrichaceae bacterium]
METIHMDLKENSYDIIYEHGILDRAKDFLNLDRKVLIVTDSGVPSIYSEKIAKQSKEGYIYTFKQGEASKNINTYQEVLKELIKHNFSRKDVVVAVGGGVVGDLSGFVAASYMRGIDFYNIPTTTLSQIDSSIGGKVAIDFEGVKNIVGAFYQPKRVLIDPETLKTLNSRQLNEGLAEAIKTGLIGDEELFRIFEEDNALERLDEVIIRSLKFKKYVVENDEKEMGLRKVLNYGHTLGHAVESAVGLGELLHGECVGLGMLMISKDEALKERIKKVLEKYNLPTSYKYDKDKAYEALIHDKKANAKTVSTVIVDKVGSFYFEDVSTESLRGKLQ